MKMQAQIMLRVLVPFEHDISTLEPNLGMNEFGRETLIDPMAHEEQAALISIQRIDAARYAEETLVNQLAVSLPDNVDVVEASVEEVTEC